MLNTKYLSNCNKIKKNVIKMFIPMLFSFKNNKLTKSFYAENKYYKIFYLIYNHISVIRVFFKDKKIFYNFSKYFQINLYIFLIKKKLMILNLFFYFFYTLFLTFENLEDISTNQLFFKGYKHRLKYETFTKGWVKPDHSLKFYFLQRINSISLYVLNFHIYKNFYFSKYNLFLINTKLIYKLFYYFKLLQYKLQSFVILYRSFYKFEKKIRLFFAKTNCVIYKNLNNKLILLFSLYKSFLIKKEQTITNFPVTSLVSNIINLKNNKIKKKNYIKPIYTSHKIKLLLNKKKKILKLNAFKKLKNFFLANYVFNFFFKINLNFSYFNLFYHNILKLNWLKTKILTNKSYYHKIFTNFLINFLIKYSIATKLIRRYDINTNEKYFYKILDSFINKLKKIIIIFLLNFFNLINLTEKVKLNFIDFILDKFNFNLLFQTLANCKPVSSLQTFYLIIFNIFEQFLLKNFKISTFYNDKTNLVRYKSRIIYSNSSNHESEDFLLSVIQFHRSYNKKIDQYHTFFNNLIRNKLSKFVLSITDLPEILYYILDYDERYKILKEYFEIHFKKVFAKKKLNNIKKLNKFKRLNQKLSVKLISELNEIQLKKKQKKTLLKLLKKKINFFFNNFKYSKFNYLKQVKTKNLLNYNFRGNNILFNKKLLFFSGIIHLKKRKFTRLIKQKTKKRKLKNVNLKKINLKKQTVISKIKKNIYNKQELQYDNKNLKKKLFKVIKTEKKTEKTKKKKKKKKKN